MNRWFVSVPVWGDRCVDVFCATALPALERAILMVPDLDVRLVVHTDNPRRIKDSATEIKIEPRGVPAGLRDFDCLSNAHRDVLEMSCFDDVVVLLTADMVVSEMALSRCRDIFNSDDGKRVVACACMRTNQEGLIRSTSDARQLLEWGWNNRHLMTEASTWPDGHTVDLSRIYFEEEGSVVTRNALPHPLAVKIDRRRIAFSPTVDANLVENFSEDEIHVECSPDELGVIELSPINKYFDVVHMSMKERWAEGLFIVHHAKQRWLAGHRILLVGDLDNRNFPDVKVMDRVLR